MTSFIVASFIAGALTVLAPCIFAALPLVLGRSGEGFKRGRRVITGLLVSIFVFTFLLKVSTALLGIPTGFWQILSGGIVALVGAGMLWPNGYARLAVWLGLERLATAGQRKAGAKAGSPTGDYLLGASLGPVFSACSPTYAIIVAVVLPLELWRGTLYLLVFLLGLGVMLLAIALGGSRAVQALNWSLDPNGWFKRSIGVLLLVAGLAVMTGLDRTALSYFVERGWYDWQIELENQLR